MLSDLWMRLRALFRRRAVEAELDDELRFHLERQIEKHVRGGLAHEEARRRARVELGGVEQTKEECRDARGTRPLETLIQDVRFGLRILRKSPGFASVAILTLALGIGANAAIFSITYTVLLKQLPLADASRLVQIWSVQRETPHPFRTIYVSETQYEEIRRRASAFSEIGSYNEGGCTLTLKGRPSSVRASIVSGNFFSVLGARPLLGRAILRSDAEPGRERVAMLSEGFWSREFGRDPAILGKTIAVSDISGAGMTINSSAAVLYTVVGILPKNFPLPDDAEVFLPAPSGSWDFIQRIAVGRLMRGATLGQADAQLNAIASGLLQAGARHEKEADLYAESLRSTIARDYRTNLLVLFGAVGFLLLLACLNTSNLVLSRASARRREVALRQALGATRARLLRQLLVESVLLALLGGAVGVLFAAGGTDLIRAFAPPYTPRLNEVGLDVSVLLYMLGISCLVGLLLGLPPAFGSSRVGPGSALKESGNPFTGFVSHRRRLEQKILVVAEISLALLLAVGSMLMIRSLWKLTGVNLGYRVDRVLSMWVQFSSPPCAGTQAARPAINLAETKPGGKVALIGTSQSCRAANKVRMSEVVDRVRGLPGVEHAAFAIWRPLSTIFMYRMRLPSRASTVPVQYQAVSPGYFQTLGIPLAQGRWFSSADSANSRPVVIVSGDLAKRYFSGHPLGKRLSISRNKKGQTIWLTVVGEVGDTRDQSPERASIPALYVPLDQTESLPEATLLVRTSSDPAAIARAVSGEIWSVDEGATVTGISTLRQVLDRRYAEPLFRTLLLGSFGLLGLLLAAIGIFGVISCTVTERTHELGVRVALGADAGRIARFVLGEGMVLAGVGIAAGVAGGLALATLLRAFLFGVSPTDPISFIVVALLLGAVALAACYVPARRAMRVDPVVALRHE